MSWRMKYKTIKRRVDALRKKKNYYYHCYYSFFIISLFSFLGAAKLIFIVH